MYVLSPHGDDIPIGMCTKANVVICIIKLYDCMIAKKGQCDPKPDVTNADKRHYSTFTWIAQL